MPTEPRVAAIAHVIQLAVAPVFLLMGVTAMLGVLMNRLGRIIDRGRRLEVLPAELSPERRASANAELVLLVRRARLVNWAVSLCTSCALLICAVIAALFLGAFFERDLSAARGLDVHRRDGRALRRARQLPARDLPGDAQPAPRQRTGRGTPGASASAAIRLVAVRAADAATTIGWWAEAA